MAESGAQGAGEWVGSIGYIGLGDIGGGMAWNLVNAGLPAMVYDIRASAMEPFVAAGARSAGSIQEVAEFADVIHMAVVYDHDVRDIIAGDGGILEHGRPGQTIIVHSTVFPETVRSCAEAARKVGIELLDAPVSGMRGGSAEGTLTLMVGGAEETVERCMPLLEIVGSRIFHVGDVGAGEATKLANNVMTHANRLIYLEALDLAEAYGIDEKTLQEVVSVSSGMSFVQKNISVFDAHATKHTLAGSPEMPYRMAKDLRYATQIALDNLLTLPMIALGSQVTPGHYARRWARQAD